jgi:hypothetical protein
MAVDIGVGIAIAGVAIPAAAVWITAIRSKGNGSSNGNGNNGHCKAHSGIEATLLALKQGQDRIEKSIERIFDLHDEWKF